MDIMISHLGVDFDISLVFSTMMETVDSEIDKIYRFQIMIHLGLDLEMLQMAIKWKLPT